jgi:two-component system nitrogen regulation response regulator NtrX
MKILIIDDEINICLSLKAVLEDENYNVNYAESGKEGLDKLVGFNPDVILLDVKMNDMDGLETLENIKKKDSRAAVIMISGHSGIAEAVTAIKLGAFDFIEKPLSLPKVKLSVKKACEFVKMTFNYKKLQAREENRYQMIGSSSKISELKTIISKVAKTNAKVLIRGESGTGKELIAYAVHSQSPRADKPFVKFNSAAIPNELVESELFGYEKGAFTGADKSKKGKLEEADGGTLFLDEIGDMSLSAQAKILRVIQEGEFERVGSNKTFKIDARIIAATHKDLEQLVEDGEFRHDLFYRLNVVPIKNPALREHSEDILDLILHFSTIFSAELNVPIKQVSPEVIAELRKWQFSGNVRELRNLIERIYIFSEKDEIDLSDLKFGDFQKQESMDNFFDETIAFADKKKEFEKNYITTQLKKFDFNISNTAKELNLQQSNLSRKIKDLEIDVNELKKV